MIAKAVAVLQRDVLTAVRYRNGLLLSAFGPATQLALSFYLAHAVGPQFKPEGMSYFGFLLIGTGLFAFLLACMHGFLNVVQEAQRAGTLEVLMTTSTRPVVLLWLAALTAIGTAFLQFVLYLTIGLCIFPGAIHVSAFGIAVVLFLSALIAVAFGICGAGLQISIQKGSVVLWLFGSVAWILTGTLFPVGALPSSVRMVSQWLPLTHSLTGMRLAVFGGPAGSMSHEIEILTAFTLAILPASIAFFAWTLRRARQLGTLSFY